MNDSLIALSWAIRLHLEYQGVDHFYPHSGTPRTFEDFFFEILSDFHKEVYGFRWRPSTKPTLDEMVKMYIDLANTPFSEDEG